jgi:hypothetical protein
MQELRPGLWTWAARHPEAPDDGSWGPEVRSYAYDAGECVVLFDPQSPPSLLDNLAEGKDVGVVLTCEWHQRSKDECVERFGAHVYAPDDDLPADVEVQRLSHTGDEVAYWIPQHGALVTGDVLTTEGDVRARYDWLAPGVTEDEMRAGLAPLRELPVQVLLATHGDAVLEGAGERLRAAIGE